MGPVALGLAGAEVTPTLQRLPAPSPALAVAENPGFALGG